MAVGVVPSLSLIIAVFSLYISGSTDNQKASVLPILIILPILFLIIMLLDFASKLYVVQPIQIHLSAIEEVLKEREIIISK